MTNHEYKIGIFKLIKKMNLEQIKLVFEYAHQIFLSGTGN